MSDSRSLLPTVASGWVATRADATVEERARELRSVEERVSLHFLELHERVFRYLTSGCRDVSDAEELRQETFLRLYRALKAREPIGNVRCWVFKVARNLMLDHAKRLRRIGSRSCEMPDDLAEHVRDPSPTPEEQMVEAAETDRRREELRVALPALTALQRECVYLRSQGLQLREIGDVLGMDMRRVSEVLQRAVATLKRTIGARASVDRHVS